MFRAVRRTTHSQAFDEQLDNSHERDTRDSKRNGDVLGPSWTGTEKLRKGRYIQVGVRMLGGGKGNQKDRAIRGGSGPFLWKQKEAQESERQEARTMNKEQVPQARCDQASD